MVSHDLLIRLIEFFPYPIQIFSLDGVARMINQTALDVMGIKSVESHVNVYNVFEDPIVSALGFRDQVKQVLTGKTVHLVDFNAPYKDMLHYFDVKDRDIQAIKSDITCFPLIDDNGNMEYFAAVFIIKQIYKGKEEVNLGKQYIEEHWLEPFDAGKTARAACLSKTHFMKLFKKHTGMTLHEYYINYKINKLKEKLLDNNLSIAQAFAECNMDYTGYLARVFKNKTGLSPSEYRKSNSKQNKV